MNWFNTSNRPVYAVIVGSAAATVAALTHQPVVWIAIAFVGGVILGWLTAPRKKDA
jgi:hypothetical protein